MRRVWDIRDLDCVQAESLAQSLQIPNLLGVLLLAREVSDAETGRRFLSPALQDLHDPFLMRDMDRVVARIIQALRSQEKTCIWGDYDVDGITATSVLLLFLKEVGLDAGYHIPSRLEEGYGLNIPAIDRLIAAGTSLLITVDCGISDVAPIQHAVSKGLDVVVLDHHQVPEVLPEALAILNPHRPDCGFPAKDLAAVGVAFNLVMALRAELRSRDAFQAGEPNLRELLDLVALGTVADIVPLTGENRIITRFGLEELSAGRRPGVAALKEVAGLFGGPVNSGQVAFRLAPRINAAGRLGSAGQGVELLTTRSYSTALALARELDQANSRRQGIEQTIFNQALEQAEKLFATRPRKALVLASDDWHVGVIGIVASRLVDRFGCPVVLIALDKEQGRGSARGVEGVHLYEAMLRCSQHLVAFGGHRMAAGLTVQRDSVEPFGAAFQKAIAELQAGSESRKIIQVDACVQPSELSPEMVQSLALLAPHGLGNPEPVFVARDLEIRGLRTVGREPPYHLKAAAAQGGRSWDVIGFRMADRMSEFGERMDLVYTPEFNTWDGQTSIQLRLIDARRVQSG